MLQQEIQKQQNKNDKELKQNSIYHEELHDVFYNKNNKIDKEQPKISIEGKLQLERKLKLYEKNKTKPGRKMIK